MSLPVSLLHTLTDAAPPDVWKAILQHVWTLCAPPLEPRTAASEVTHRDRAVGSLDFFLTTAGWDLWSAFHASLQSTAETLITWWSEQQGGRAVLILDGLSLRELPWLLQGADKHGYRIRQAKATAAELPPDTTPFARALGFGQRSSLENNGAGLAHRLMPARTEATDLPWQDCARLIQAEPNWVFWHHWPDGRLHDLSVPGQGLAGLTTEVASQLTSADFWAFVARLTTGRRLVITSDHGYAASDLFPGASDEEAAHLKNLFKSGRSAPVIESTESHWIPPLDLVLTSEHGTHHYALGRRKWKSQGGYPTLTHGGLSLLETLVPFIELSRSE